MKALLFLTCLILALQFGCHPVNTEISLDDLSDKSEFTGGMLVGSETYNGKRTDRIILNHKTLNSPGVLDLRTAGYYRIEIYTRGRSDQKPEVIRLVVMDPDRGEPEWGLPKWTPRGVEFGSIRDLPVQLIYPRVVPENTAAPVVTIVGGQLTESLINLQCGIGSHKFLVKRGVGSSWIPSDPSIRSVSVDNQSFPLEIEPFSGSPFILEESLPENTEVPPYSFIHLSRDLHIPQGITLTIQHGTFISLEQGVNIYNDGKLKITGTAESPVTLTCSDENGFWGGVTGTADGNSVEASHAIFCKSGFHTGTDYDYGHAHRQALFKIENGSLTMDHCYMIDHIGQVFYPNNATMDLDHCLVQRVKTGGQANYSQVHISHSVFTDFPNDSLIYQDDDNDGFYVHACDAVIANSIFMYATDDGLDSGGDEGGTVQVTHSRFESNFHEGAALSSGSKPIKNHLFSHCFFTDCGQGLELGWSGKDHTVEVDSCTFSENGVGIRFGDNYPWHHDGLLKVSNSFSLDNTYQDVWNMVREKWGADTTRMEFDNVWVSRGNPVYPQLKIESEQ